jgi:hypothetical protein
MAGKTTGGKAPAARKASAVLQATPSQPQSQEGKTAHLPQQAGPQAQRCNDGTFSIELASDLGSALSHLLEY